MLLAGARALQHAATPSLVLLMGPANAGKSTLFNALMGSDRVLVSAQHGTTRDVVVDRARLGAYPVDLADGPGERDPTRLGAGPAEELEREGARLARGLIGSAELVLWLSPAGSPAPAPAELPPGATVVLTSQVDRVPATALAAGTTGVSALTEPGKAVATVERLFRGRLDLPAQPWTPGAAALFEPAQVLSARRARVARAAERHELLAGLLEPRDGIPIQGS
jgi:tRNA modification GTPase